ncbi:DUF317 domain-containing protein [Streptomyces sp. NPDC059928]|uniref:DUF317 domain-containing protein n=1 Tax=unclassified Streptomyces TaxID=2593676 RepID=UPI003656EBA5
MSGVTVTVEQALVSPRYLAGGGDPAWITVPLHRACGWSIGGDPLMPGVVLSSPDQKAVLHLEPDPEPHGPWWLLKHAATAGQPSWWASFGARTPVELIAAVLDTLTDPAASHAYADPLGPLQQAGWTWKPNTRIAPDGLAEVENFIDISQNSWYITASLSEDPAHELWQARFTGCTPHHLIAAFTQALAAPAPLVRDPFNLPPLVRQHARIPTERLPFDTVAFALERRIAELSGRRPSATTRSPALRPPQQPAPRRPR